MAVYTVKGGGGLGSVLGTMASVGGAMTGNPWLAMAGAGLGAMSGGGNGGGGTGALANVLGEIINGGWVNPASGSIATPYEASPEDWAKAMRRQGGGASAWLR